MKKIFILFCALAALVSARAQCPQFLAFDTTVCGSSISRTIDASILSTQLCGDTLQITFNAAGTALAGYPKVYLHSGPEFSPFTGWQGQYTVDTGSSQAGLMTNIGTDLWTIKFVPRNYFNYPADSCLNSVVMGFRDSTNSVYVKQGTNDIYLVTATGTPVTSYPNVTGTYIDNNNITYQWNDGNTDSVRTFTTGGSYTVTATGVGGCTASGTVNIILDNKKVSIGDDTIECTTSSYVFVATPGFSTYTWLDQSPSTSNTLQALNPTGGMYWVEATDSNGCTSYDTATVHLSATGYLSLPATLSSCPGTPVSVDASTTINFNGDSLVIIYNAAAGLTQLVGDTNVYFHSAPQFYPFAAWPAGDPYTVGNWGQNDGVGRMTSLGNNLWTITIFPQSYYHFSPDTPFNGIWCVFRNFDGTLTGKDSAGNGNIFLYTVPNPPTSTFDGISGYHKAAQPLSYTWSNGAHTALDTFTTTGVYKVTVTDGVCTHTDSVSVNFSTSLSLPDTVKVCSGDTGTLNAGPGFLQYRWSNGDSTQTISASVAGTYTVTATNLAGCTAIGQTTLVIDHPAISLGGNVLKCTNTPALLTATPGYSSYEWIGRTGIASNTFTADETGIYWVGVTDANGCSAFDTITVRYSEVLQLSMPDTMTSCPGNLVALGTDNITLNGDSLVIFFDATSTPLVGSAKVYMHSGPQFNPAGGWVGAYTVGNWGQDDGIGEMDSLGNNHWSITIFPQSYYKYSEDSTLTGIWMVMRNANGSIQSPPSGTNMFLNLSTITPTSSYTNLTAIHKYAGTISYAWSPGGSVAPSIAVDSTGLYTLTVSDGTCTNSASTFVNLSNNLTVNIGNDTAICPSGSVTFNPGAGFVSYHWSNGDSTQTITVSAPGSYSVSVVAGSGCTASDTATIRINGTKVNAGADVLRCSRTTPVTLTASNGYVLYKWFDLGASSQTYVADNDGCYWLEATDSSGCTSYDTVCVSTSGVAGLPALDTAKACAGSGVSFNASTSVNAAGDSLVITFDATQNATSAPLLAAHKIYMQSAPQFYPFAPWPAGDPYTVGDWGLDNGVGEMDSIGPNLWQITIYPSCYYGYSPDTPLNAIWMVFRNADGSAQAPPSGTNINLLLVGAGTPSTSYAGVSGAYKADNNISYSWSGGTSIGTGIDSFTAPGTYYVTATEGSCSRIDTLSILQSPSPTVNVPDTCLTGGTVTLDAGSGYSSYLWNIGASTETLVITQPGSYWVRVTNAEGCTGADTVTVDSSCGAVVATGCAALHAYFKVVNVSPGNQVTLMDSSTAGEYFTWIFGDGTSVTDTGSGNTVHTYAAPGIYTIMEIVGDTCGKQDTFTRVVNVNYTGINEINGLSRVTVYPNPASTICTVDISAMAEMTVTMELDNVLGGAVWSRQPQLGAGDNKLNIDLSGLSSGMYTLIMRTSSGTLSRKLDIIK